MTNRQRIRKKTAVPRLSLTVRKQIYRWIIAGESDAAIQAFLREAGAPIITEALLVRYRGRPYVLRAIAAREDVAFGEGFARFDKRIQELTRSALLLGKMLHATPIEGAPPARAGSEPTAISRELRGILSEIDAQTHRRETRRITLEKLRKGTREEPDEDNIGVLMLPDNGRVPDIPTGDRERDC